MVTVMCNADGCANEGVTYNVLGSPLFVECGGCGVHLDPTDERDDTPAPEMPMPNTPAV